VLRRLAVLAATAAALVALPAAPALAHATLLATTPAAGYSVASSPATLTLIYDEPVSAQGPALRLTDPAGQVALGPVRLTNDGRWLSAPVPRRLPAGQYTVSWQVVADDGDVVAGSYQFAVGAPVAVPAAGRQGAAGTRGLTAASLLRWLVFTALALALGGLAGEVLTRRRSRLANSPVPHQPAGDVAPRAPLRAASLLGTAAAAGLGVHQLGGGSILTGLGHLSLPALLGSGPGRLALAEAVAFAAAAGLALTARGRLLAAVPLLAVVLAEGLRGHVEAALPGWGAALVAIHLAAAALWVGALVHLCRVGWAWRSTPVLVRQLAGDYSRLALALFVAVVATGTLAALLLLPSWAALSGTSYGQLLLAKLAAVGAVAVLALAGRRRLRQAPRSAGSTNPMATTEPGRAARLERWLLVGVLGITALLVSVAPASPASSALTLPPPPAGPVVRLGTLAGQVNVAVAASDGQLEVRTSTPQPRRGHRNRQHRDRQQNRRHRRGRRRRQPRAGNRLAALRPGLLCGTGRLGTWTQPAPCHGDRGRLERRDRQLHGAMAPGPRPAAARPGRRGDARRAGLHPARGSHQRHLTPDTCTPDPAAHRGPLPGQ